MATAYINIGSNLGDSQAVIRRASDMIAERFGREVKRSHPVSSPPWGYESPNGYVNLGIAVDSADLSATEILEVLQAIERSIDPSSHRNDDGTYRDRVIDIDLIAVDDQVVNADNLILPHPRMHLREFVLRPMTELAPQWRHPLTGLTAGRMLANLKDNE